MLTRATLAGLLLLQSLVVQAAEPVPLFDGASLQGWKPSGDALWQVEQGELVASGELQGFLSTEKTYGDFYLKVEFWVDATTNSGIFIRCQDRARIHPETCYELNIWDEHPKQEARTGAIVMRAMPPLEQVQTVGRWNTYEVLARDRHMEVRVNDTVTAVLNDADATPGFIALQHWQTGTVKFRRVEIIPF